ncbi:MAG: DJ-1/PfpI family protein [Candidatus Magasanikbacteria bacterium]
MSGKVILVIASVDFQPFEYAIPKKVLTENGYEVITVSDKNGNAYATDESLVLVDKKIDEIEITDYKGIFLIGGPGAPEHLDTPKMKSILEEAKEREIPYGAICISPRILANAGVLDGKKATGWNGDHELGNVFRAHGVEYVQNDVVVDGSVVTASGPRVAKEFGEAIVHVLQQK